MSVKILDIVWEYIFDYMIFYFNGIDRWGIKYWNILGDRIYFCIVYFVDFNGFGEVGGYFGYMFLVEFFENGNM